MTSSLSDLIKLLDTFDGDLRNAPLAGDVKMFLWEQFDPDDELIYPNIDNYSELLEKSISSNSFTDLNKDEVLSILFGMIQHDRIVQGSWNSLLEEGVTQKLLKQLLLINTV